LGRPASPPLLGADNPLGVAVFGAAVVRMMGLGPKRFQLPLPVLAVVIGGEWIFELFRFRVF
jgi:hypothetical protein